MDPPPAANASALRRPFIATANALTALYKTAATAEREARASGERTAYLAIIEWVARRNRAGLSVGAADVAGFASERLAAAGRGEARAAAGVEGAGGAGGGGTAPQPGAGGDDVVRSIRELRVNPVNPRKRARADIGDAFLEIWGENADDAGDGGGGAADIIAADTECNAARKVAAKKAQGSVRSGRRRDGDGN
jgi:hypothetical protein